MKSSRFSAKNHLCKDYSGSRLTVNAGFDNLDQRDIKAVEKSDIGYNSPDYRADKNHYEISDLAYKIDGDLVAVYSFKSMDETDARKTLVGMDLDKTEAAANTTINLKASVLHTDENAKITDFKVFDSKGNDVSAQFAPKVTAGYASTDADGTLTVASGVLNGEYTVKAAGANGVYDAGRKIVVSDSVQKLVVDSVKFAKPSNTGYTADNKFYAVDPYSFVLEVKAGAYDVAGMETSNLKVKLDGQEKTVSKVEYKGNGFYVVSVAGVDFTKTPDNNRQITVELVANSNLNLPATGLSALVANTDGAAPGTPGQPNAGGGTQTKPSIEGVGNVAKAENVTGAIDTVDEVKNISVELKAANGTTVVTGLKAKDFTATVDKQAVTLSDGVSRALTATVKENATKGKYDFTFAEDLRGKTVEITVNGQTVEVKVDAAKVVVSVSPETLEVTQGSAATGTATVDPKNADKSKLKIWLEGQTYAEGKADATDTTTGVKATLSDVTVTLSEQVNAAGTVKFVVGVGDNAGEKAVLTVNAVAPKMTVTPSEKTAGVVKVDEVKASATYTVTYVADKQFTATVTGADGFSQQATVTASNNANDTAAALKTQLEANGEIKKKYTVTNTGADVKLEALKGVDAEEINLSIATSDAATVALKGDKVSGVAAVPAKAGQVKFTVANTATAEDAGKWELTVADKKIEVTIADKNDANAIAEAIRNAVKGSTGTTNLTAEGSGAEVIVKENTGSEGKILTNDQFAASFEKKTDKP